jgi:hypothetical protein
VKVAEFYSRVGQQAQQFLLARNNERAQPIPFEPSTVLLIAAIWFGVITGLAEVALLAVKRLLLHKLIFVSTDTIWMAPLADVLLFAVPALILFLLARKWQSFVSLRVIVLVFSFMSYLSVLLMITSLDRIAVLVLAAGLATQTARLVAAHPNVLCALVLHTMAWARVPSIRRGGNETRAASQARDTSHRLTRREFLLSAGTTIAGLAVGVQGWQLFVENRALADLPPVPSSRPNVLLVVLDTVRAQNLGLYGYQRPTTPQIERLAQTGVRFERAISTAPWTLTSHASLFTGHYPHELSANWDTPLDATYPTLAEVLAAYGYLTGGFVGNNINVSTETGLNRGFAHYEDYQVSLAQTVMSSSLGRTVAEERSLRQFIDNYEILGRKTAEEVSREFLRWLAALDRRRPFFAFLNYFDAHSPYLPPQPFAAKFEHQGFQRMPLFYPTRKWSTPEIEAERAAYDGAIAYIDYNVG